MLFGETGLKPSDFTYAVFHQPNPRFPVEVAARLGFTAAQIKTGVPNPLIGNTYAASSPIGLAAGPGEAKPHGKNLLARVRAGARSDALCFTLPDAIGKS